MGSLLAGPNVFLDCKAEKTHAGADQVCWNCRVKSMIVEDPPAAQTWAIGCTVKEHKGDGVWQSIDKPVSPASLYLAQLAERLGPQAVKNIGE